MQLIKVKKNIAVWREHMYRFFCGVSAEKDTSQASTNNHLPFRGITVQYVPQLCTNCPQ